MVIGETDPLVANQMAHPSGVPQDKIDNIMGGISNTGAVKMNNHRKKLRQRFDIIKKLGQGTYGKVQLGINKETGQEVAIKTIKKCKIEAEADLIRIRREVQIMSSVQHPNIIHIYEVFENREKMVLVMEFAAGGELYDYLSERKVLAEDEARRIFRQVSTAVYYCHKHKICHRDLKLENILLDENGNAKIADFGLSNVFDDQRLLATFCGSPLYASPEIVKGTPYQGPEVDCWSLGVLLYTLVYGAMPFDGSNFKRLVKQISQGDYYEPKKPSPASPLIREMLTVCPKRRATIEQICNHWWVNEGYKESCLNLAEDLANQTPVRLDVLLSLSPVSVTADQLVVPSTDETKSNDRVARSHSVGSIRDIGSTEAERRILDMVAAGGEAALMPSPTRTITPAESPVQTKRKLETTISMENAMGAKKKEKPTESLSANPSKLSLAGMDAEPCLEETEPPTPERIASFSQDLDMVENMCDRLIDEPTTKYGEEQFEKPSQSDQQLQQDEKSQETMQSSKQQQQVSAEEKRVQRQRTITKLDSVKETEEVPHEISPTKVIKKFVNKHKTADLVAAINKISPELSNEEAQKIRANAERKNSLPDESLIKNTERRRSRIFETAEKFQNMANNNNDKPKKIVIPGVSVGNFKKEFERKASLTNTVGLTSAERRLLEKKSESADSQQSDSRKSSFGENEIAAVMSPEEKPINANTIAPQSEDLNRVEPSDSKSSLANFSLEEARRSMENSIALLNQAKNESSKEVDQLCAKTESVVVSDKNAEREKKLKNAREIIGNAIQPNVRMGIRKPPVPFGMNGRSTSGTPFGSFNSGDKRSMRVQIGPEPTDIRTANVSVSTPEQKIFEREPLMTATNRIISNTGPESPQPQNTIKTSRAEITLKSATLPRRKTTKAEIQLDIKPKIMEQPIHFTTEMQHQVPDLRSAPIWEPTIPYSPLSAHQRSNSLEPQTREHVISVQRPPSYTRSTSNTMRSGSLSRQSTNESDTETIGTNQSQTILSGSSQPIKKSPREFIIPIAVEGGGYVTPRAGSLEPSESSHTSSTTAFSRLSRPRRVGSLLTEADSEEESPFQKLRTTSISREGDSDEPRFTMHRLRSTRPIKKLSQDTNDSQSSGEDDDEDGFEILTAENLFSTLLQRVRALTNRLNVNNDISSGFPNSRLLSNIRQSHTPFWHHEPFGSRLNNSPAAPWRHSMSRDLSTDIDSMFSRTGATLPRGKKTKMTNQQNPPEKEISSGDEIVSPKEETLDLADLDLSRLKLTKKDLETLSSITPGLPKCFQDQLLAKLPPNQARKLSRTLSMQNSSLSVPVRIYKRSFSGGREIEDLMQTEESKILNEIQNHVIEKETEREKEQDKEKEKEKDKEKPKGKEKDKEVEASESVRESLTADKTYSSLYRKNFSQGRYEPFAIDSKSRSSSICKSSDEYSKSLCSSYSSEVSDKYKYYSPYLDKKNEHVRALSPYKYYDSTSTQGSLSSPTKDVIGRPPTGCLSPPPVAPDTTLRRRSSQRRISRFLRPDFFETPKEESVYARDRQERERETQSVLREIREKSRERSRDRCNRSVDRLIQPSTTEYNRYQIPESNVNHSVTNTENDKVNLRYTRNKSVERFCDYTDTDRRRRRSLSKPNDLPEEKVDYNEKCVLAQKILDELETLSTLRNKSTTSSTLENSTTTAIEKIETTIEIKKEKTKKSKPKEVKTVSSETSTDTQIRSQKSGENLNLSTKKITKTIKKEKKVSTKNSEFDESSNLPLPTSQNVPIIADAEIKIQNVDIDKTKKESKLIRPKSYPSKEQEKMTKDSEISPEKDGVAASSADKELDVKEKSQNLRPKSYPTSKIVPPKDIRNNINRNGSAIVGAMEKLIEKIDTPSVETPITTIKSESPEDKISKKSETPSTETKTVTKKIVKVKKSAKSDSSAKTTEKTPETEATQPTVAVAPKEKSPEKKPGKGLLYTISQKFEKLRETAKSKEKKLNALNAKDETVTVKDQNKDKEKTPMNAEKNSGTTGTATTTTTVKKKKVKCSPESVDTSTEKVETKTTKGDRKSRIDAMIRSLRERSVPRAPVMTESGLIKRAVSVEDMSGAFNKCSVNKVLGIFKRFERDDTERKVLNTRSTSNIERQISGASGQRDRPKSSGFVSKLRKNASLSKSKTDVPAQKDEKSTAQIITPENDVRKANLENGISTSTSQKAVVCPDCTQEKEIANVAKRHNSKELKLSPGEIEVIKDKRKGLMLDFSKVSKDELKMRSAINGNILTNYTNLFCGNDNRSNCSNNNNFVGDADEINQNHLLTPSSENIANYSSDSRSPHEDFRSTSTFLSPTEEPELCFDNWSVCSEDNYMLASPSPALSRRSSQYSSPTNMENRTESIIDRIKRRSYYCRFNEKKPKRQSNIVGPAAKDYYRESASKTRSRTTERVTSPEPESSTKNVHEYLKPLKLSSAASDLKTPFSQSKSKYDDDLRNYRSPSIDYGKTRPTLNDSLPPTSSISRRYDKDYLRSRNPSYDPSNTSTSTSTSYYSTYNPKRRSSFNLNGLSQGIANTVDGYATLGRRIRPYENRSISLLDSSAGIPNSLAVGGSSKREQRTTTEFGNLPKSNLSLRTSSVSRSPSNI